MPAREARGGAPTVVATVIRPTRLGRVEALSVEMRGLDVHRIDAMQRHVDVRSGRTSRPAATKR